MQRQALTNDDDDDVWLRTHRPSIQSGTVLSTGAGAGVATGSLAPGPAGAGARIPEAGARIPEAGAWWTDEERVLPRAARSQPPPEGEGTAALLDTSSTSHPKVAYSHQLNNT